MTENSRHRLAGRTEEGELTDMTETTDKKIEDIIDATADGETTEEKAAADEQTTTTACECCCGVHMGDADGKTLTTAAHAAAGEFDADETKEAAKHVVDGAATVGKNVAGVVKKFVSTLVSKGGKDDTNGVKTDEAKDE